MAENRRRFTRVPFNVVARLVIEGTPYDVDSINDLSIGGCSLKCDLQPVAGTACEVHITLGETEARVLIEIGGTVIRYAQGEIAVKFTSIDPDGLYHLQRIILYNAEKPVAVENEIKSHPGLY